MSFPGSTWIGDYSTMQKELSKNKDVCFSLHDGDKISDLDAVLSVNGVVYWRDEGFSTDVIAMEILDDSFIDLNSFIKAAAIRKFNMEYYMMLIRRAGNMKKIYPIFTHMEKAWREDS